MSIHPDNSKNFLEDNQTNPSEQNNISVTSLINEIPLNTLNDFYDIETSIFKKRIDKLNLKFYWESESLGAQKEIPKPYNKLFLILFKQINLFTDEIERLNLIIRDKNKNEKYFKDKIFEFSQKEKERILTKQMLKNYQKQNKLLEKRMKERLQVEEKLKYEIEKLKQQNGQNYTSNVNGSVINNSFVNNITKGKNNQSTNKRNCHSIDTRAIEKSNISVQKKVKQRNRCQNGNYLNNSMILPTNKTFNTFLTENNGNTNDTGINKDLVYQCLNHFNDEIDNLEQIETFLEKQKKEIKDVFTKSNFTTLKNTLKGIPR